MRSVQGEACETLDEIVASGRTNKGTRPTSPLCRFSTSSLLVSKHTTCGKVQKSMIFVVSRSSGEMVQLSARRVRAPLRMGIIAAATLKATATSSRAMMTTHSH